MSNYVLILLWLAFMAFLTLNRKLYRNELVDGRIEKRLGLFWAVLVFIPLVVWVGNRGYIGDTYSYMRMYRGMPTVFSGIPKYMETISKDKGFYFLSAILKVILGSNVKIYFGVLGSFQISALIYLFRKNSPVYIVSIFLFIASTDYISWLFNGIRQFTAVAITLFAFPFILNNKYVQAIIVILFASCFHGTALLLIPFVFICQGRAWNKKTILFILITLIAVLSIDSFTNILDDLLMDTQYKNVVSDWKAWEDDGTNVFRVLVYAIPTILSLVGLKFIRKKNSPLINMCTNMSIVSMGFYIISMFTSGIFIGRLPIYFSLYGYILLPWEIENMFTERSKKIVYIAMCVGYLGFYLYSINMLF